MLKYSRTTITLAMISAMASIVLFQNCAQTKFNSISDSTKSSFSSNGGGEGYGGKLFVLVSPHEQCPSDPSLNPSEISVNSSGEAYLISQDCEPLNPARLISVSYASDPSILFYNAQTYREEGSSAPFTPVVNQLVANIEAENMTVKPAGYGIKNGFLVFNDNGEADENVMFPSAGQYYLVIRAQGKSYNSVESQMQINIDGNAMGVADIGDQSAAEYTFIINVPSGTHKLGISFINDDNVGGGLDRDLLVDWFKIFN